MSAYYFKRVIAATAVFMVVLALRLGLTSGVFEMWLSQLVYFCGWLLSGEGIVLPEKRAERFGIAFMLLFGACLLINWMTSTFNDDDVEGVVRGRDWAQPPSRQRQLNSTAKRIYR